MTEAEEIVLTMLYDSSVSSEEYDKWFRGMNTAEHQTYEAIVASSRFTEDQAEFIERYRSA